MARIQVFTAAISSGTASHSAEVDLGHGEFNRFAVALPAGSSFFSTEVVNCRIQGSPDEGTTWYTIGYSNNPATASTGFTPWEAAQDAWGSMVICEGALFAPYVRLDFTATATAAADCYIFAGKD